VPAALLVEDEVVLSADAEPVQKLQAALHEDQEVGSPLFLLGMREGSPQHTHHSDDKIHTALKGLDPGELRDLTLPVEVLDPASQVLQYAQEVIYNDLRSL
jgi:hypothetical protein